MINEATTIPFPSPRTEDAIAFLEAFHPSKPRHLAAILDDYVVGQTFTERDPMRRWIDGHQGRHNIYFHVNSLTGAPKKPQAVKNEVAAALYLHADIDDASDATLTRLRSYTPPPTAIVFSGGGYQAFWELTEPCRELDRVEACNQGLARALGGDNCHNINRIMRLPGTINVLSQKKRAQGRVPALAYLVEADWTRSYAIDQFAAAPAPTTTTGALVQLPDEVPLLGADDVPGLTDAIRTLLREGDDPERPRNKPKPHYKSRSEALFGAVTALVRADCDNVTIAGLILNPELKISELVLDKPKPKDYARKQIGRARAAVEATEASFPDLTKDGWPRSTLPNTKVAINNSAWSAGTTCSSCVMLVNGQADRELRRRGVRPGAAAVARKDLRAVRLRCVNPDRAHRGADARQPSPLPPGARLSRRPEVGRGAAHRQLADQLRRSRRQRIRARGGSAGADGGSAAGARAGLQVRRDPGAGERGARHQQVTSIAGAGGEARMVQRQPAARAVGQGDDRGAVGPLDRGGERAARNAQQRNRQRSRRSRHATPTVHAWLTTER